MTSIRLGFMPLIDAAIPVVAAKRGFAQAHGLDIQLLRETSWANIRDRLAIGEFEAAHLLAPLPLATALGLTPLNVPIVAPMALGLGGNGVTASQTIWQQMQAAKPDVAAGDAANVGAALKMVIGQKENGGLPRLRLAVVHSFSAHNYELRYWLDACGIKPGRDVEICIISPPLMPAALAAGHIDGFCVGEPWNSIAQQTTDGAILLTKSQIWRASPEKVLGVRQEWAQSNPEILTRLIAACIEAAIWADDPGNADALAALLAEPDALDMPINYIQPAIKNGLMLAGGHRALRSDGMIFNAGAATFPWRDHALWFLRTMMQSAHIQASSDAIEMAANTYRPDLYRRAAAYLGVNAPLADAKPDSIELQEMTDGTIGPLHVPASNFFNT